MDITQQRTKEIKEFLKARGNIDLIGIADPALVEGHGRFHAPEEVLPGVKSIIVFGRRLSDGAVQSAMRRFEDGNQLALGAYAAYASHMTPGYLMLFDTFALMQHIERAYGYISEPVPCATEQGGKPNNEPLPLFCGPAKDGEPIDIDQAAVAAGLGQFGWSGRILTPEYGPRVMFGALLTQLPLECDKPYSGPQLCDPSACHICTDLCPTDAIAPYGSGDVQHRGCAGCQVETGAFNKNRCLVANCAMRAEFDPSGKGADYVSSNDPTDGELAAAFEDKDLSFTSLDHFPKIYCEKCLLYCPVGNWKERFADRGLSQGPQAVLAKEAEA